LINLRNGAPEGVSRFCKFDPNNGSRPKTDTVSRRINQNRLTSLLTVKNFFLTLILNIIHKDRMRKPMGKDPGKIYSSVTHENDISTVEFVTYLREDFVNTILRIRIKERKLLSIFFHSNTFGVAEWQNGEGFMSCNRWEDEDQAKSQSYLSRHYTTLILNGSQNFDYALENIVPDVCSSFNGEYASEIALRAAGQKKFSDTIELNALYRKRDND